MKRFSYYLRYVLVSMICVSMVVLFAAQGEAGKFKKEYKMQLNVGPSFYWGMGATKFAELVKQKTNGQINVKPYYSSVLLKGAQLKSAQLVAKGVIDCAYESTINISPVITGCNVFSLPFFINTFENLDKMENGQTGKAIFKAMDKKGLVGLAWAENGFRQVTNSKRAIHTPEDLKGLRLRVVGSPIFIDTFRQLGADPVNMNWGDAVTAFQQGVVDGQENTWSNIRTKKFFEVQSDFTESNHGVLEYGLVTSTEFWNSLPKDIQTELSAIIKEVTLKETQWALEAAAADKDFIIASGRTKIHTLTDEQAAKWATAMKPVWKKFEGNVGKDNIDAVLKCAQ